MDRIKVFPAVEHWQAAQAARIVNIKNSTRWVQTSSENGVKKSLVFSFIFPKETPFCLSGDIDYPRGGGKNEFETNYQ